MEEWAGLGYYARARNLHAAARAVVARGGFPRDAAGLRALPGIGAYTAAAVAAIAFGEPVVPADGNVERVVARLLAEETPLPAAKPRLAALAQGFMADAAARARPGDFAQALFDLGATHLHAAGAGLRAVPLARRLRRRRRRASRPDAAAQGGEEGAAAAAWGAFPADRCGGAGAAAAAAAERPARRDAGDAGHALAGGALGRRRRRWRMRRCCRDLGARLGAGAGGGAAWLHPFRAGDAALRRPGRSAG